MDKKQIFIKQYNLSDLFDGTIRMIGKTWKNSLRLLGIAFIPVAVLSWLMILDMYTMIPQMTSMAEKLSQTSSTYALQTMMSYMGRIFAIAGLLSIIVSVLSIFVRGVISLNSFNVAFQKVMSLKEMLKVVLKEKLGILFLQILLMTAIISGVILAGIIAITLLTLLFTVVLKITALGIFISIIGALALYGVLFWLIYSFTFAPEAVILDNCSVLESLKKSFNLVKGNWWRVFGFHLLISLTLSFAISLVISPITMFTILPDYMKFFEMALSGNSLSQSDMMDFMANMYQKFAPIMIVSSYVQSVFTYLVLPVFLSLFYLDLKVKKGELEDQTIEKEETPEEPFQEEPPASETAPHESL